MILLDKKPFSKKIKLSYSDLNTLFSSLPKLKLYKKNNSIEVIKEEKYKKLIIENWKSGVYSLNEKELENLYDNDAIKKIKKKLIKLHNLKTKDLDLKSSCIFYPSYCKYEFNLNKQNYRYHKYHLDSGYRIKALIILKNSDNESQQFSYINKFPEPLLFYFFKRHYFSKLVVLIQKLLYFVSLKQIRLSGQPPKLPLIYQDPKLYKKYNSLKSGELITFNNLYPHSSHNGFSLHKTPMLQLVFNKKRN
tara:strand:- start:561 stop:1307 length:747 start_codon:yes stop_codon:yes gene_type:complete